MRPCMASVVLPPLSCEPAAPNTNK
uniref:Uncharacterized protein n=1 Tax=Arundo donax TaxID=35708 RepID=A0A0A8ZAS7_ARUDO